VNAFNMPVQNALNFPAGILQPPNFDPTAPDPVNYGSIGAVIGHEISHSFDNLGSEFDAEGRLRNWWTDDDLKRFRASSVALVAQYAAYRPLPDLAVNGVLTLGENIADLAGLAAAFDAYQVARGGKPVTNGGPYTDDQLFFLAYAQSRRTKSREPVLRRQLLTDSHAPADYRTLTVRNLDAWYEAFSVKPGQRLYLAPEARVRVW
jgi:putative endopeptidase